MEPSGLEPLTSWVRFQRWSGLVSIVPLGCAGSWRRCLRSLLDSAGRSWPRSGHWPREDLAGRVGQRWSIAAPYVNNQHRECLSYPDDRSGSGGPVCGPPGISRGVGPRLPLSSNAATRKTLCVARQSAQPTRIGQDETGLVSERRLRVGLVIEPTGIDDPYIHGAYLGLERAVRELGIRGRVLTPAPKEGYVPSLSLLARQKYDLVIGILLCRPRDRQSRHRVSRNEVRDHRRRPRRSGASPEERPGPRVQRRASRLSGRPPGCARADALSRGGGDQLGRRPAGAGGGAVHRRLPGRRARSQSSRHDVEQLYRRLHRPRERQVGRPEPDREGIASRVPGRQRLRTRGAGGGKRAWNLGDRSRCRPIPPRPSHPDERA